VRRPGCRRHNSRRRRQGPHDPDSKASRAPSRRWERANARVRRIHAQVAAIRAHEIHQATTDLATRHEVVAVEQLAAENMGRRGGRRKRGLNRALADAALGRIRKQLDYKTTWCGTTLVTAPPYFPSTQLCSHCGAKTKLRLGDRTYRCRNGCPPLDGSECGDQPRPPRRPHPWGKGTGIGSSPTASVTAGEGRGGIQKTVPTTAVATARGDETSTPHTTKTGTASPQGAAA